MNLISMLVIILGVAKWCSATTCADTNQYCASWAAAGDCANNPGYMLPNCPVSCNQCTPPSSSTADPNQCTTCYSATTCADTNQYCASWAAAGECANNPGYMLPNCPVSCKQCTTPAPSDGSATQCTSVQPIPASVRSAFSISPYYQNYAQVYGMPVVGSPNVSTSAIERACYLMRWMLADYPAARAAMLGLKHKISIVAKVESITDLPEFTWCTPLPCDATYQNWRARAYGATTSIPTTILAEENLNCDPEDNWHAEDVCVHEMTHSYHLLGLTLGVPSVEPLITSAYNQAMSTGLWVNTYGATNEKEYVAECVEILMNDCQCSANYPNGDGVHNNVCTRAELQSYDPTVYNLLTQQFWPCGNTYISRCGDQSGTSSQSLKQQTGGSCSAM